MVPLVEINSLPSMGEALGLFLIALFVAVSNYLNKRETRKVQVETKKVQEETKKVKVQTDRTQASARLVQETLTENNGGSTIKDQLDRIEVEVNLTKLALDNVQGQFHSLDSSQKRQDTQMERIESTQDRQEAKIDAVDKKVNDHIQKGKEQ